ncbi:MAG: tRNA (adenosine(37)-N6)-threonylcarbamoyltransferase complex dimerization subunit type 1 TsaB [Candidatus Acidiferrum sp.]
MTTLAIDTCEARGSVAVRRSGLSIAVIKHLDATDYSAWLLPAVERALAEAGVKMEQLSLVAVATGPGSFTGLRVGLTTVKAWAEVYGHPIVGVSRLEAMARLMRTPSGLVAACYNAQRGQMFGGLYRSWDGRWEGIGDELVIAPGDFVELVEKQAGEELVTWICLDPELITDLQTMQRRVAQGDTVQLCEPELATSIGALAELRAAKGEWSDPLSLDANYVRRSDAEIFWKGPSASVR